MATSQVIDPEQATTAPLAKSKIELGSNTFGATNVSSAGLLIFILPVNFAYEASLLGNCLSIPSFIEKFGSETPNSGPENLTHYQQLWNGAAMIGIFVAAFTARFASDVLGRRLVIYTECFFCIVDVFIQSFASSATAFAPVFVAEIAPDELRDVCLTLINTMIVLGQWGCALVAYGGSFIKSYWGWTMPFLTQLVPPVLILAPALPLLPESPSCFLLKDRREEAANSLAKFNSAGYDVKAKLTVLEAAIEQGGPYFFTVAGANNPKGVAQGAYAIQLVGNLVSWFLVDRVGRRPMIVWGMVAMTGLLLAIGCTAIPVNNRQAFSVLYQATPGAMSFAVGGETPTARLRQKTYSINIVATTAAGTLVSQLLPYLINPSDGNLGGIVAFVLFVLSLPLAIYFFFCLSEMKGRSYLELEEMFQKKVPSRRFKDYVCEEQVVRVNHGKPVVVLQD